MLSPRRPELCLYVISRKSQRAILSWISLLLEALSDNVRAYAYGTPQVAKLAENQIWSELLYETEGTILD